VGYFRSIICILQTICKHCARVLLPEADKTQYRIRLSNENLSYMTKRAIRKKIIDKCKKLTKCPHCKETNGFVKKMTASKGSTGGSVLKIMCEKNRSGDKEAIMKEHIGKCGISSKHFV
jgi:DNA-directed RNA polymerase beta' subunit